MDLGTCGPFAQIHPNSSSTLIHFVCIGFKRRPGKVNSADATKDNNSGSERITQ